MKVATACLMGWAILSLSLAHAQDNRPTPQRGAASIQEKAQTGKTMKITIGSRVFMADLRDNQATQRLTAMLPLTVEMSELNGNEKYFHLPTRLPTDVAVPELIHNGDLMLYGANSLVLFYKTFRTTYSYTPLGRVRDPAGLASSLGAGSVTVTFELE